LTTVPNRARFLAAAAAVAVARPARAQTPAAADALRVGLTPGDSVTPCVYAQHAGTFAKAGLAVDFKTLNNGAAVAAAVAGGSLDVGNSNTLSLVLQHSRGIPVTIVAPCTLYLAKAPYGGLLTLADSPIRTAHDLIGKTLSVTSLNDLQSLSIRAWLDQNNVEFQAVRILELPPPAVLAALAEGRIDAGTAFEPIFSQAILSKKYRVFAADEDAVAKRFQDTAWFANADWAAAHRDLVNRFARVIRAANVYVDAHESETIPLVAAATGIDAAILGHMVRPPRPAYADPADLQPIIDIAARYKLIAAPFPAQEILGPSALRG
jgi:NitT/TauT family transport system substrate-binding protein